MKKFIICQLNTDGQGSRAHRVYPMPPAYHLQDTPPHSTPDYWKAVTDVPCPSCEKGTVRWHEAGYVPGYRICDKCKNHFLAKGNAQAPELVVMGR